MKLPRRGKTKIAKTKRHKARRFHVSRLYGTSSLLSAIFFENTHHGIRTQQFTRGVACLMRRQARGNVAANCQQYSKQYTKRKKKQGARGWRCSSFRTDKSKQSLLPCPSSVSSQWHSRGHHDVTPARQGSSSGTRHNASQIQSAPYVRTSSCHIPGTWYAVYLY